MNPFRSVGARLSLALLLVVAGALALVYAAVAPSLESRLVDSRLNDLERSAPTLARRLERHPYNPDFFESAATTANARVALLRPLSRTPPTFSVSEDVGGGPSAADVRTDPLALKTSTDLRTRRGTVSRDGERFAEVAVSVGEMARCSCCRRRSTARSAT